jgi:hypothetical protein
LGEHNEDYGRCCAVEAGGNIVFLVSYFLCLWFLVGPMVGLTLLGGVGLYLAFGAVRTMSGAGMDYHPAVVGWGMAPRALLSGEFTPCIASRSFSARAKLIRVRNLQENFLGRDRVRPAIVDNR